MGIFDQYLTTTKHNRSQTMWIFLVYLVLVWFKQRLFLDLIYNFQLLLDNFVALLLLLWIVNCTELSAVQSVFDVYTFSNSV